MSDLKKFNAVIRQQNTQAYLQDVLGAKKDDFVANLTALVANDRNLAQCEPATLMYAAMTATALDLPLDKNLGQAYVIPFKNNKAGITEAQFQMGWKGLVTLAQRSGVLLKINADVVYEGELRAVDKLTGDIDLSGERTSDKIIGYFAFIELKNGFRKTLYMSREDAEKHGKRYSQTFRSATKYIHDSSKWVTDFDAMSLKTVVKQLLNKWCPKDTKMNIAMKADQGVQRSYGEYTYVDNDKSGAGGRLAELAEEAVLGTVVDEETGEVTVQEAEEVPAQPAGTDGGSPSASGKKQDGSLDFKDEESAKD